MRPLRALPLVLFALLPAPSAAAGGLPATEWSAGPEGVVGPNGAVRFGALATADATAVTKTTIRGGRVKRAAVLEGRWGVPVVAQDRTPGGLSTDGATLVLRRFLGTYPPRRSAFAVLGTGHLAVRDTIELRGNWAFDALSPHASTLYLVRTFGRAANRYEVRAYDLRARRLLPDPIVDPSEPDEPMVGYPMARATGPGGRWVYTLYQGGEHPFVHALDTINRTALCLDLPKRVNRHLWRSRLAIRGDTVEVRYRDRLVASVSRTPQQASTGSGPPWAVALVVASGLAAAVGARRVVMRPRSG